MFSEPSGPLKSPAAKHTFNCIIALKIVFVQSIAGINCGSMRLVLEKKFFFKEKEKKEKKRNLVPTMTEQTLEE